MRQPLAEMGAAAADMLLELVSGHTPDVLRVELSTRLVVRDSCAPPPVPQARNPSRAEERSHSRRVLPPDRSSSAGFVSV